MKILRLLIILIALAFLSAVAFVIFGGPKGESPYDNKDDPFAQMDLSDLPPAVFFDAKDGDAQLAYRFYPAQTPIAKNNDMVLIHGLYASNLTLHLLAKGFSHKGYNVYSLDLRGHGLSGVKGNADYIGQLEDDMASFVQKIAPKNPILLGFSLGGGFALRLASSPANDKFDKYILLSPFISALSPITKKDGIGKTASRIGTGRLLVVTLLNKVGLTMLNNMPIAYFHLSHFGQENFTHSYSYNLAASILLPPNGYQKNIAQVTKPMMIVIGEKDELFVADAYQQEFAISQNPVPVVIIKDAPHLLVTMDDKVKIIVDEVDKFIMH